MRISTLLGCASSLLASTAILAGCSSSPQTMPAQPLTGVAARLAPKTPPSRIAPQARARDLLYASDSGTDEVNVYTYPQGMLVGQLTGLSDPQGLCTDASGDVFVTDRNSTISEYAHGGTSQIATLPDPGEWPIGCAVDPTTGNLAVANWCKISASRCSGPGSVSIYAGGSGIPKQYFDEHVYNAEDCTYDDAGNLYIDGLGDPRPLGKLAELPKGGANLTVLHVVWTTKYPPIKLIGGIQWDGAHVAVADASGSTDAFKPSIYVAPPNGGRFVDKIRLGRTEPDRSSVYGFAIDGRTLIAPDAGTGRILFYRYPNGGRPMKVIRNLEIPIAVVVSKAT